MLKSCSFVGVPCKAWFALSPTSALATQPLTAEQSLTLEKAEREAGVGLGVLADFLDDVKLRTASQDASGAAGEGKVSK